MKYICVHICILKNLRGKELCAYKSKGVTLVCRKSQPQDHLFGFSILFVVEGLFWEAIPFFHKCMTIWKFNSLFLSVNRITIGSPTFSNHRITVAREMNVAN